MDILFVRQGEYKKGDAAFPLIAKAVSGFFVLSGEKASAEPGGPEEEADAVMISRTSEGRPFCVGQDMPDISVTHSGDIWMCLVSDSRCGVDFQYCREQDTMRIVNRFYTQGEREYIEGGQTGQFTGSFLRTEEGRNDRFFDVWVRREALGKYEGHGFFGNYPDSAPGGILAESIYIIGENTAKSRQVFIHEITPAMLAAEGVHASGDFRAVCVSESDSQLMIKTI